MKRKILWLIVLLLIFILTAGIPSCSCDGADYVAIRNIRDVIVFDLEQHKKVRADTATFSENLAIQVLNEVQYFSSGHFEFSGTMSEALACDPSPPQVANQIVDIKVFCNIRFKGIPSQTNIADQLQFGVDENAQLSLPEFLDTLPKLNDNLNYFDLSVFQIFISAKPEPGVYTFTIEMKDNNGNIFKGTTIPVKWM